MPELDFCRLEITVIHSLTNYESGQSKFNNVANIAKYFKSSAETWSQTQVYTESSAKDFIVNTKATMVDTKPESSAIVVKFDNEQLNCELKIVDSTEDGSDTFTFTVYNVPDNTIFVKGDYLLFKWYWLNDKDNYTMYHGTVQSVKSERSAADLKTTIKGALVDQDILYNYTASEKYPKLTYYSDVKDFVENELKLDFKSTMSIFTQKNPMPSPILTRKQSVGVVLEKICEQVTKGWLAQSKRYKDDKCKYKFINGQAIYFYRDSDLLNRNETILNKEYKIPTLSVHYSDLLEFQEVDGVYTIQVFGLPTLKAGIAFYIDCTDVPAWVTTESAYFLADEVEQNITLSEGYICKIYARLSE